MAYIVLTEAEASAAETVLEGLERMKAVLEANRPILRAGGRTVGERSILISAQSAIAQFPAIQIEPTKLLEVPATLGAAVVRTESEPPTGCTFTTWRWGAGRSLRASLLSSPIGCRPSSGATGR